MQQTKLLGEGASLGALNRADTNRGNDRRTIKYRRHNMPTLNDNSARNSSVERSAVNFQKRLKIGSRQHDLCPAIGGDIRFGDLRIGFGEGLDESVAGLRSRFTRRHLQVAAQNGILD